MKTEFRLLKRYKAGQPVLQYRCTHTKIIKNSSITNVNSDWKDVPVHRETKSEWMERTQRVIPNE